MSHMPVPIAASTFLTSPAGQGLAAGVGGAIGGMFGGKVTTAGRQRDARFTRDMQNAYDANRFEKYDSITARVRDATRAGLHPLAALGIAPASGGGSLPGLAPAIPGQHDTGSAVETGINTMLNAQRSQLSGQHAQEMQGMRLEEQQLRNDWLRSQIMNSESKRLAAAANFAMPAPAMRPRPQRTPHPGEKTRPRYMSPDGTIYSAQGGTSAEVLEQDLGEWADWMPHTLGRAYDVFKAQMRNVSGVKSGNTFYDRHLKKGVRKDFGKFKKFKTPHYGPGPRR